MINILTNKLPESKDKNNVVWRNNNPELYEKYCQHVLQKPEIIPKKAIAVTAVTAVPKVPKVLNVIPVSNIRERDIKKVSGKDDLVNTTIPADRVHAIIPVDISNSNIPVDSPRNSIIKGRNCVVPVELDIANIPVDEMRTVVVDRVNTKKKPFDKKSPMKIILEESLTYDTYRDDVRDKIIKLISTKEFNKVFGITKSAEIMSGIANDRFNKSTVLFLSFLFDKCVIYNNKNIIYNKNNGIIMVS
jgi:hypothetical protein